MDLTKIGSTYSNAKSGNLVSSLTDKNAGKDAIFEYVEKKKSENSQFLDKLSTRFYNPQSNYKVNSPSSDWIDTDDEYVLKYVDDPTLLGFRLIISSHSPLFNTNISQTDEEQEESAFNYLLSINQIDRAKKLLNFIESFKLLIDEYPYYMSEMSGLGDIYKIESKKSYYERKLKIKTIESIDMFISAMMHDYINAVYDFNELKWVVPINLLFFDIIIYISEVRKFKSVSTAIEETLIANSKSEKIVDKDNMFLLNKYIGAYALRFNECEFTSEGMNGYLSTISHTAPKPIENEINMKLGKMSFHLTNLHPFSHIQQYYDEIYPHINPINSVTESDLSRFGNEKIEKSDKTLFQMAGDAIKKEAKSAADGIVKQIDTKIGNTISLAEDKLQTLGKELVSEYSPANISNRLIGDELSKVSKKVNDGLNSLINDLEDKTTNKTGNLIKSSDSEHLASLIINQDGIQSSQSVITGNGEYIINREKGTSEPLPDIQKINKDLQAQYKIELKEKDRNTKDESSTDINKRILDLILDGTSADKLLRETLFLRDINQKIN